MIAGRDGPTRPSGPDANERLTTTTAAVLVVLLVALGVTVIHMNGLVSVHMLLGLLLVPPVLLKLASTGYRFARYYTRSAAYRAKGPPQLPLRVLAPPLVLATVAVFATGVVLMADGRKVGWLLEFHKVSFIVWLALFGAHALAYAPRVARSLVAPTAVPGGAARLTLIAASIAIGATLAVALLPTIDHWHA